MREPEKVRASDSTIGIHETTVVKARSELYTLMYEIAKEHKTLAEQVAGQDMHRSMRPEIKESMISILFSYTCLEAYINALGRDRLGHDWQRYSDSPTEGKWKGVSEVLASRRLGRRHSVFSKGKEPFRSFLELEDIRNDCLVHWRAEFGDVVKTKYGRTEGTVNVFNCKRAAWACAIVKEMVAKLNESIDSPPSLSWLD